MAASVVVATAEAAKDHRPLRRLREHGDRPSRRRGHAGDQDVVVADVPELVGQDTGELVAAQDAENAGGHRHYGVVRVTPGSERVWRRAIDDGHARLRQMGVGCELVHELVQLGGLFGRDLARAGHLERDITREPVRAQVHDDGDAEEQQHAAVAPDPVADDDQQAGQGRQQDGSFQCVVHGISDSRTECPRATLGLD
jgi:hypothetical protein